MRSVYINAVNSYCNTESVLLMKCMYSSRYSVCMKDGRKESTNQRKQLASMHAICSIVDLYATAHY